MFVRGGKISICVAAGTPELGTTGCHRGTESCRVDELELGLEAQLAEQREGGWRVVNQDSDHRGERKAEDRVHRVRVVGRSVAAKQPLLVVELLEELGAIAWGEPALGCAPLSTVHRHLWLLHRSR